MLLKRVLKCDMYLHLIVLKICLSLDTLETVNKLNSADGIIKLYTGWSKISRNFFRYVKFCIIYLIVTQFLIEPI